jgi:hypothetical protein
MMLGDAGLGTKVETEGRRARFELYRFSVSSDLVQGRIDTPLADLQG